MLLLAGLFQNMSRLALQYGTVFRFWLFSELYVTLQDPDCVQVRVSSSNGNAKYVTKFSKDTFGGGEGGEVLVRSDFMHRGEVNTQYHLHMIIHWR